MKRTIQTMRPDSWAEPVEFGNPVFEHLHVHNEHSSLDGLGTADQFAARAKELGFQYLAITNHGNITGAVKHQRACDKHGIKPIFGCEFYCIDDIRSREKPRHLLMLAKTRDGFDSIAKLCSEAQIRGFYRKPRIDFDMLMDTDLSGVVITTACCNSWIYLPGATEMIRNLQTRGVRVFAEFVAFHHELQFSHNKVLATLMQNTGILPVATCDCHYVWRSDSNTHEVLLAIQQNRTMDDPKRWKFTTAGWHLRGAREVERTMDRMGMGMGLVRQAMVNSIKIAMMCGNVRLEKMAPALPDPPASVMGEWKKGPVAVVELLCVKRLTELELIDNDEYVDRMTHELKIIRDRDFSTYFVIIKDIVDFAREKKIMVGPGRGSVGGSLVAYLMGITPVDPLEHNLKFERFISADRIDYPDIDLDFEVGRRGEIVEYIRHKYGNDYVCGISTEMRFRARAALRDVGRMFKIPEKTIAGISIDLINVPDEHSKAQLQHYFRHFEFGLEFQKLYPEAAQAAERLEGQVRGVGLHPAAVVVSPDNLTDGRRGPVKRGAGVELVSDWDMEDSEMFGLVKIDVLGLSTLDVISTAIRLINDSEPSLVWYHYESESLLAGFENDGVGEAAMLDPITLTPELIPLDDPDVYKQIRSGDTAGIFQISARATTELAREMEIENFEELVACIALVRPGPTDSGMTKEYVKRKKGFAIEPGEDTIINPVYGEITKDTYGLLVFQEQIMEVIHRVAGLDRSTADRIRKVIGKKRDATEFEKYKIAFFEGAAKTGVFTDTQAQTFWTGLQKWANYGFNRAHSVEYSLLAVWTAFLKVHFPVHFLCACLTHSQKDEKQDLVNDVLDLGIEIIPPKYHHSNPCEWRFTNGSLYMPFAEIDGVGPSNAAQCCKSTNACNDGGFFQLENKPKHGSTLDSIMADLKCYKDEIPAPDVVRKYIPLEIGLGGSEIILDKRHRLGFDIPLAADVRGCTHCELRTKCTQPVLWQPGFYNAAILGEGPGWQEDQNRIPFYDDARAGALLWAVMAEHALPMRQMFHVTNTTKCYPGDLQNPSKHHVDACAINILDREFELLEPPLILALGNWAMYAATGAESGVTKRIGEKVWSPRWRCWVVLCGHPAWALRSNENRTEFSRGIKAFAAEYFATKMEV